MLIARVTTSQRVIFGGIGINKGYIRAYSAMAQSTSTRQQPPWLKPESKDKDKDSTSVLYLYNSLTRSKTPFIPINGRRVTWYTCGPTVYDASHIGHARNYVTNDILRRILQDYFHYDIHFVMNITDIDDKIIIGARQRYLLNKFTAENKTLNDRLVAEVQDAWKAYVSNHLVEIAGDGILTDFTSLKTDSTQFETYKSQNEKFQMYYNAASSTFNALQKPTDATTLITASTSPLAEWLDAQHKATVTDPAIFKEFSTYWEKDFMKDMESLNVLPPTTLTRVSEYVPEIVTYIEKIIANGFAYEVDSSIYFDTEAFGKKHYYAKLEPWAVSDAKLVADGEGSLSAKIEKKSKADFALWKKSRPGEPAWESPWGQGRPGWHIECSVMASEVLGSVIDIHSGGIDLAFPHHDNELAQSEAYHDCPQWINYFLHMGHLHIQGQKMSKSLKNFINIKDGLKMHTARQLRLAFVMSAWNTTMQFKSDTIKQISSIETIISNFFANVKAIVAEETVFAEVSASAHGYNTAERQLVDHLYAAQDAVHAALCDSLNTTVVMNEILDLISKTNVYMQGKPNASVVRQVGEWITYILRVFGLSDSKLGWDQTGGSTSDAESQIMPYLRALSSFRDNVRKLAIGNASSSDILRLCDQLRDVEMVDLGVSLDDRENGTALVKLVPREELIRIRDEKAAKEREKAEKKAAQAAEAERKRREREEKARINPFDMFKEREEYGQFDTDGIPTHLASGEELPKSRRKKLQKEWDAQKKLYDNREA